MDNAEVVTNPIYHIKSALTSWHAIGILTGVYRFKNKKHPDGRHYYPYQ